MGSESSPLYVGFSIKLQYSFTTYVPLHWMHDSGRGDNGYPLFQTRSEEETPVSTDNGIDNATGGQLQADVLVSRDVAMPRQNDTIDHS